MPEVDEHCPNTCRVRDGGRGVSGVHSAETKRFLLHMDIINCTESKSTSLVLWLVLYFHLFPLSPTVALSVLGGKLVAALSTLEEAVLQRSCIRRAGGGRRSTLTKMGLRNFS